MLQHGNKEINSADKYRLECASINLFKIQKLYASNMLLKEQCYSLQGTFFMGSLSGCCFECNINPQTSCVNNEGMMSPDISHVRIMNKEINKKMMNFSKEEVVL